MVVLTSLAGSYTVLSMGTAGLSNAVGFWTGSWLLGALPIPMWVLIHYLIPPLSVLIGLAWLHIAHRQLPWREAAVIFPTITVGTALLAAVA